MTSPGRPRGRPPRSVTPPDEEILALIGRLTVAGHRPPTIREMAAAVGLRHPGAMHRHLLRLQRERLVDWEPGRNRSLRVLQDSVSSAETREPLLPG